MGRPSPRHGGLSRASLFSLRFPLAQFLLFGALAFRLVHGSDPFAAAARREERVPVVLDAAQVARMREDYAQATGLQPNADDEAALVDRWIDEELLYREAQARGLDRNDRSVRNWLAEQARVLEDDAAAPGGSPVGEAAGPADPASRDALYARALELGLDRKDLVVRRILVQKMRLLAARSGEAEVGDHELRAFLASHPDDFRAPARTTFRQAFFANRDDGAASLARATTALDDLRAGRIDADVAVATGDAFALPSRLVGQSRKQVEKIFGADFARRLAEAPIDAWSGPWESPAGWHLVTVEQRVEGENPQLEAVRGRVLESWREKRRAERLAAFVRELRTRQPLEIESRAWQDRSRS